MPDVSTATGQVSLALERSIQPTGDLERVTMIGAGAIKIVFTDGDIYVLDLGRQATPDEAD